jgi:hypothetical protein
LFKLCKSTNTQDQEQNGASKFFYHILSFHIVNFEKMKDTLLMLHYPVKINIRHLMQYLNICSEIIEAHPEYFCFHQPEQAPLIFQNYT